MTELTRNEKRKYALALRRVDYGVLGYMVSVFRTITLTTREGDDMSTDRFKKDLRKLMDWLRSFGYKVEYCGVFEFSPLKKLLHWHGLLRVKGGYLPVTRRMLGDKWNEIHNAFAVKIEPVLKMAYLKKYINKHMVKDYLSQGIIRNKFLVSKGWCRQGYQQIVLDFKHWWKNGSGELWMSKEGWHTLNKVIRGWCEARPILVTSAFGWFSVTKGGVVDAEIYGSEE